MTFSRLEIRCPDGTTNDAEILLDGVPVKAVRRVSFNLEPNELVLARIEVYVDLTVDASVRERVFELKKEEGDSA